MNDDIIVPYNINNILISENDIKILFKKYDMDISVNNIELYRLALTHKSYITCDYTNYNNNILKSIKSKMNCDVLDLMPESSERIEFLGDTVIKCIVSTYLFIRYFTEDEGFLTKTKTKIENRKSLAIFARKLGIDKYLIISKHNEDIGNRNSDKFLEDAYESFIGALYLDQGFDFCKKYIWKLLESEIDYAEILYVDTNFKDKIQRYFHQNQMQYPIFQEIACDVIDNKKYFTIEIRYNNNKPIIDDDGKTIQAQETSKKKAEQKASMFALIHFKQLNQDQIVSEFDS